jgi:RimJ/RimL family protein N-acetyltransferase
LDQSVAGGNPFPERFRTFQAPHQDVKGRARVTRRTLVPSILTVGDAAMSAVPNPSLHLSPTGKHRGIASFALRWIRPDDAAALQAFVRALSPTSRRMRFHMALNELTESRLQALTRVDQRIHVAFVLTTTERGTERIVGEARYVVSCDKETAEFAIAVADELRGQGLAERLLAALVDAARAGGLRWLVGDVLVSNTRMRAFARRCGFVESTHGGMDPEVVRVERCVDRPLVLAQADQPQPGTAHRVLSHLLGALVPASLDSACDFQQF